MARAGRLPVPDPATVAALTTVEGEHRHRKELVGEKDLEIAILKDRVRESTAPSRPLCHRARLDHAGVSRESGAPAGGGGAPTATGS